MCVSITAAAVGILSPERESMRKMIAFISSLAVCAMLISPILGTVRDGFDIPDVSFEGSEGELENGAEDAIIDLAIANICSELEGIAEEKFGIKSPSLTLVADKSDRSSVKIISGHLSGEGNLSAAAKYIEKELECEIGYEEG